MFELPTRSDRKYSGKYPDRITSIGYAWGTESQKFIAKFLGINRPVHLELNCGRRFIADASELKMNEPLTMHTISEVGTQAITPIEMLTQERYDQMLAGVRNARGVTV